MSENRKHFAATEKIARIATATVPSASTISAQLGFGMKSSFFTPGHG